MIIYNILYISTLVLALSIFAYGSVPKSDVVKCAVCRSLVTELHNAISKVNPRKTIDVGSYRINADGTQKLAPRKYAGSEVHMTEVLETICKEFESDYAQARHKETNKLEAIKLVENGVMNPRFSEYEMVQDPDLNKNLKFHCESIVEDFEDEIVAHMGKHTEEEISVSQEILCGEETDICSGVKDEL